MAAPAFLRMCMANFFLFASVYVVVLLQASCTFFLLLFAVGMLVVGPFHAYLGDAYKRKHVYLLSALLTTLAGGAALVNVHPTLLYIAALLQGAGFGLAVTAGITLAIDITPSEHRTSCNVCYATVARLGMIAGILLPAFLQGVWDVRQMLTLSLVLGALGLCFAARVHVAFRAPIGMTLYNMDRFFLPRAWLPAVNVLLKAMAAGLLMPLLFLTEWRVGAATLVAFLMLQTAFAWTRLFVNLSQHCQRGTANTTFYLATDLGVMAGLFLFEQGGWGDALMWPLMMVAGLMLASILLYVLATDAYYRKHRVR